MTRSITRLAMGIIVSLATTSVSLAANDVWDNTPIPPGDIRWENGTNWADGTTPGNGDTATFNLPVATQAAFAGPPAAIQALTVSAPVFFQSSGGAKTLSVTSASGGQDVTIGGAVLALGTAGNPMHLTVGDDLTVSGGGLLRADFGSQVNTLDLFLATVNGGGNGTIVVDGTNSRLNVTNNISMGLFGNAATLVYQNDAQGTLTGSVTLANSSNSAAAATLSVASSANLTTGSLAVGTGPAAATGTINIHGLGSTLVQSGASTLTVGTAAAGIGALNIGTTATGGSLTTGTGLFTINATGTVTIGSATTNGTLHANGNVTIDGGGLTGSLNSRFNLANGKTMTITGGGSASFADAYHTASNAIYNVTGSGSNLTVEDALSLLDDATVNVSSGGLLSSSTNVISVGGTFSGGTLIVDGSGSSAVAGGPTASHIGASGGASANVTFSNNASGSFIAGMELANSLAGTTATVNIQSGADLTVGFLGVARSVSAANSATLNVQGSGSTVTQVGAANLVAGHPTRGTAAINIGTTSSGAILTTGTGLLNINKTATLTIGDGANSGTLNANGNVTIDGGVLTRGNGSTFALASGKTMTIQNGGTASFSGSYNTASNATYNITGGDSTLETTNSGQLAVLNGAQIFVSSGGMVSSAHAMGMGVISGNGTLSVDGDGSSAVSTVQNIFGRHGFIGTATFSNEATGTFGDTYLANDGVGSKGLLNVLSDADMNIGRLFLAVGGVLNTEATLNVQGNGSTFTQTGASTLDAGHATGGIAEINIGTTASGAIFTTGTGLLTIKKTATLTIGDGANTGTLNANGNITVDGGVLQLNNLGSTFALAAGKTMTIQNGGRATFSSIFRATNNAVYNISGADSKLETIAFNRSEINNGGQVNVSSGGLASSADLLDIGVGGNGTLSVDGNGSSVVSAANSTSYWGLGAVANVTFTNNATGMFNGGIEMAVGTMAGSTANVNILSGADLSVGNLFLASGGGATVSATLNVNGSGSTITQSGASTLNIGHSSTGTAAINIGTTASGGTLTTGTGPFTINKTGTVNIGSGANSGTLNANGHVNINGGTLTQANGSVFNFSPGKIMTISNGGTVVLTTFNDNGGTINLVAGTLNANTLDLNPGAFNFTGGTLHVDAFNANLVNQGGTLAPGHSAGNTTIIGSYTQQSGAALEIEIGGLSAGSGHDLLGVTGNAILGGELQLALIGAFVPAAGNTFTVLNATGIFGVFSNVTTGQRLTTLDGTGSFLVHYGAGSISNQNQVVLTAFQLAAIPGDYNQNGIVDAADYVVWRKGLGTTYTQEHYNIWRAHFGRTAGSGSGSIVNSSFSPAVPEPAAVLVLVLGVIMINAFRRC